MRFWKHRYGRRPSAVIITGISGSSIRKVSPLGRWASRCQGLPHGSLAKIQPPKWDRRWPGNAADLEHILNHRSSRRAFVVDDPGVVAAAPSGAPADSSA